MKAYGTRVFRGLVVVFALFCSSLLHAQSTSQTIQGLVTDQSGAIVPAAAVTITNLATGIETPTSTNETGNYSFQLVLVGNYEVTCKLEGFKTKTVPDLRVATGDQKRADFALELGDISETIEVIASAVGLYTENATPSGGVVAELRVCRRALPNYRWRAQRTQHAVQFLPCSFPVYSLVGERAWRMEWAGLTRSLFGDGQWHASREYHQGTSMSLST